MKYHLNFARILQILKIPRNPFVTLAIMRCIGNLKKNGTLTIHLVIFVTHCVCRHNKMNS